MTRKLALLFFLTATVAHAQHVYRTNFPATENPISQSGNWRNGHTNGIIGGDIRTQGLVPATGSGNFQSTAGWAYGTTTTPSCGFMTGNCNDSVAVVSGVAWGGTQMACATIHLNTAGFNRNAAFYELALHLNGTINANNITSYEILFSTHDGSAGPYVGIVRGNGPLNNFTTLNQLAPTTVMTQGQLFCAAHFVSGQLQAYIDGVPQFTGGNTVTDSTFTGGAPGISAFNEGGTLADNVNFGFEDFAARDTFTFLADCNESTVNAAVASATDGMTFVLPNGNCTWTGPSFSTSKQVAIVGMSSGGKNTIIKNGYVAVDHMMNFTTGASFNSELGYFQLFYDGVNCKAEAGNCSGYVGVGGTGLPILIHDGRSDGLDFASSSNTTVWGMDAKGGVFWNFQFTCEDYTASHGGCDSSSVELHPGNWDSASTMGILDTNEATNVYIEDSKASYQGQFPDVDSGGRIVIRYTQMLNSDGLTHGATSGTGGGGRHVEFYQDAFQYVKCPVGLTCTCLSNTNTTPNVRVISDWMWFRGGTGVFHDVSFDLLDTGSCSGVGGLAAFTAENISSNAGGLACCVGYQCWHQPGAGSAGVTQSPVNTPPTANATTGALQPTIGTDSTQISDPIYFWNTSGTGAGASRCGPGRDPVPNQCNTTAIDTGFGGPFNTASFVHQNRDWFYEAGPKPGYVSAAYPHPARNTFTQAAAPIVSLSPSSVSFGNVLVGSTSPSSTVKLTNAGNATLSITGIALGGTNPTDFGMTNNCGTAVLAGGSCSIVTTCTPLSAASFSASVSITDNAAGSPQSIPLTCTGVTASPAIGFAPTSITFAGQTVGTSSAPTAVTVTNTGGATLTITGVSISGGNATSFTQTNNCGSVAPAGTCTINVTFSPQVAGALSSSVSVTDNAAGSPQSVPISGTGNGTAGISFTPTSLPFGNQTVGGTSAALSTTVKNIGTAALTISAVGISGTNSADFAISSNTCITTLAVNATCAVAVTFTPGATGARSASLNFTDTAPASPQSVALTGTGTQSGTSFSPTPLAFGNQNVSATSAPLTTTLTNTGSATLNISSITITGTNASDFAISSKTCGTTVTASGTCTVSVTFTPGAAGPRSANLSFADDAPGSPQTVPLTGTGIVAGLTISPSSLTFPATVVGQPSATQTITITNSGTVTVTFSSVVLSGGNTGDFSITSNCGNLTENTSCTVIVTFTPTATGARSSSVVFTDTAPGSPQSVPVSGTGTQAGAVVPATLAFANQPVGTTSGLQALNLHNNGTATLHISSITIGGTNPSYFAVNSSVCGATLAAGATCSINITFTPQTAIAATATVVWADDGPGAPQITNLSGTGTSTALSFNPASVTFPNTALTVTSAPLTVTVSNTGNGAVTISSIAITGTNSSNFAQTNNCGASLAGNSSCTVTVRFTPSANGSRAANLVFTDSAPGSPQTVSLQGVGFTPAPQVTLSVATVTFGNQTTGTSSNPQVAILTNTGTSTLTISSTSITGTNSGDFGQTSTCGATLAVNASCTYSFVFTPTAAGGRSATFNLTTNAASSPDHIALSGTGVMSPNGAPAPQVFGDD